MQRQNARERLSSSLCRSLLIGPRFINSRLLNVTHFDRMRAERQPKKNCTAPRPPKITNCGKAARRSRQNCYRLFRVFFLLGFFVSISVWISRPKFTHRYLSTANNSECVKQLSASKRGSGELSLSTSERQYFCG